MALLTLIPEELRDYIIELVVSHERKLPLDPETAQRNRTAAQINQDAGFLSSDIGEFGLKNVFFEKSPTIPNANGLLLTNKAIHSETKQAIKRLFPDGLKHKLDVLFLNESKAFLTWLAVLAFSRQISEIDVTVQESCRARVVGIFVH